MSKQQKESFFWASFSDLMTSLFFVMLLLFVLVIVLLHKKISEQAVTITELERITQIDRQFDPLIKSGNFLYFPKNKKFVAKDLIGHEIFQPNQSVILNEFIEPTKKVGFEVLSLLEKLSIENKDYSYLLIVEGNLANKWDRSISKDSDFGYKLSYERALAVYQLWRKNGIDMRKYNTEIIISGSGFNGLDRDSKEENNKRFTIQIIPKISSPQKEINNSLSK